MESIQSALNRWLAGNEDVRASLREMKQQLLSDPDIRAFLSEHPELTQKQIDQNLIKLYEYQSQSKACEHCQSLGQCINVVKGFAPTMSVDNGKIKLTYHECPSKEKELERQKQRSFVQSLYMPKEIYEASFNKIYSTDDGREIALEKITKFYSDSKTKLPTKGVFLYGPFGVGKSYMLAALANELAKEKIDTFFIYMPEFVREMKASISDSTIGEKIDRFKNASVLVFDDIGAEFLSPWFRDEILGSILHYRMMENLPVFFTSNYTPDELLHMLSRSGKGDYEELKSARIMERIRQVSEPVPIDGKNYRNQ